MNCDGRGKFDDAFVTVDCPMCDGSGKMRIVPYRVYNEFNLNDHCQVKMTAKGLEILRIEGTEYFNHNYNAHSNVLETSIWVVMEIFGKHMFNGGPNLFVDNKINVKERN